MEDLFFFIEHARCGQVKVEGCPKPGHGEGQHAPAATHASEEQRCAPAGFAVGSAHVGVPAKVKYAGHDLWRHPFDRGKESTEVLDVRGQFALPTLDVGETGL